MNGNFYTAFEARFRGSRELISKRLKAYVPFLEQLLTLEQGCAAIDLGCGRGEWLELLRDMGFQGTGVDLDDAMLADCRSRHLQVLTADAIDHLRTLPDASHCLVSALHLVEHIPFDRVLDLVDEAHRVLAPGGLLILETPNAENLIVGTSSFYLDPTHQRPMHPLLLAFVAEFSGFRRGKVLRLNGEPLPGSDRIAIVDVLTGVSPDCAVIAQKAAGDATMAHFDALFQQEWGISLQEAASTYDSRMEHTRRSLESVDARLRTYEENLQRTHRELVALRGETEQMRNELGVAHQALTAIQLSRSWRWTAPARRLYANARLFGGKALRRAMPLARDAVHRTPWTKALIRSILRSTPFAANLVSRFLKTPGAVPSTASLGPAVTRFENLPSVELMAAITRAERDGRSSIIHIGKDGHGG